MLGCADRPPRRAAAGLLPPASPPLPFFPLSPFVLASPTVAGSAASSPPAGQSNSGPPPPYAQPTPSPAAAAAARPLLPPGRQGPSPGSSG
ncbi:hypothetical protein NL676_008446 [Syzygium grande]|nr:hypothetical protein NL676_008446 [Syzygium grande]